MNPRMRKLRWEEYFSIPVMVILVTASLLFMPAPVRAVSPPVVEFTAVGSTGGGATLGVILRVVAGDVIIVNSGVGVTGNAGITNLNVSTITDNNTDVFQFVNRQQSHIAANCASFCGDAEIWSALSKVTGHALISITWTSSGTGNSPGAEMLDVRNIAVTQDKIANGVCNLSISGCGTLNTGNTSTSITFDPTDSFEDVAFAMSSVTWDHFVPGANYAFIYGIVNGPSGKEYATAATSPNNFPFSTSSGTVAAFGEAAAEWGNPSVVTNIVVVPCTAFQLQCWWYPFYFFGIYMVLIMAMGFAAKVPAKDMVGLMLESFSLASLLAVMLGIINVMFPLIITIVQVVRAIRE